MTTFDIETTDRAPDVDLPQRVGRALWAPMLAMALLAFGAGIVLAFVRASALASGDATAAAALGHLVPAAMFLGFAAVFAAISFAIARILGEFRIGGGTVQETAGTRVRTLRRPPTARAFIVLMAMAMMLILGAVTFHAAVAVAIYSGNASVLAVTERWAVYLEAARRLGVAVYLFAIALGLATIITVLRFQSVRLPQVADEVRSA